MKKKVISVLLATTMVASLFVGCGNSSADKSTDKAEATEAPAEDKEDAAADDKKEETADASGDEDVTITYWGWDSNFYEPTMKAYEKLHPNVHFEPTATEWGDMLTKAQQALASGSELPTIIPMDVTLIENWKDMDIMEDMKTYGLDTSKYVESAVEKATTEDGKVIGLFENVCPAGIAYKRDLAKEYFGTDDPTELQSMFSSYDAYVEKGKEVAEKSGGKTYMFHSGQAVAEWLYFASDVANMDGSTIKFTDKMTDVMSKLIALRDAGAVDTYASGTAEANATYADKEHIFYPTPDWALTYYIEGNDPDGCAAGNWGLIKAPVSYSHGGTAMGITSASTDAQKQAAYDFITWCMSDPEGVQTLKDEVGYITIDTNYTYDENFAKRSDEAVFGGQDISSLYYKDIVSEMKLAPSSAWDNSIVSVRNDIAQQLMDDTGMDLNGALTAGKDELTQLVTDSSISIE